jgi:hypothetical protein
VHDFASPANNPTSPTITRTEYPGESLRIDTQTRPRAPSSSSLAAAQTDEGGYLSPARSIDSTLRRRPTRSNTVRHYHSPSRPKWEEPGAEPGIDTSKEIEEAHHLQQQCDIKIVDFSDTREETYHMDNTTLPNFLQTPKESWVACRWINVNGLSYDVVRELGNHKNLHRLAMEDLMNTRGKNRAKADWYSDHCFRKSDCTLFTRPSSFVSYVQLSRMHNCSAELFCL